MTIGGQPLAALLLLHPIVGIVGAASVAGYFNSVPWSAIDSQALPTWL
jgi:hypothetical protein